MGDIYLTSDRFDATHTHNNDSRKLCKLCLHSPAPTHARHWICKVWKFILSRPSETDAGTSHSMSHNCSRRLSTHEKNCYYFASVENGHKQRTAVAAIVAPSSQIRCERITRYESNNPMAVNMKIFSITSGFRHVLHSPESAIRTQGVNFSLWTRAHIASQTIWIMSDTNIYFTETCRVWLVM